MTTTEVALKAGPSLDERARRIAGYHTEAESHRAAFEENAIRAGEELIEAQEQLDADPGSGLWGRWLDENFPGTRNQAYDYMRRAREFQDAEITVGVRKWCENAKRSHEAYRARNLEEHNRGILRESALNLRQGVGLTYEEIAEELGVSRGQAYRLVEGARRNEEEREARKRSAAAVRAAETRKVRKAVKKAGVATAELYAMAERMQDVLAQAHDETSDPEARRALDLAGQHYRKMRDEIVRALAVS